MNIFCIVINNIFTIFYEYFKIFFWYFMNIFLVVIMKSKLKKIVCKQNSTQKTNNQNPFTIHSTRIIRQLFASKWSCRILKDNIFLPRGSAYL